MMVKTESD